MREKLKMLLQKYVLQKGRVYGFVFPIAILSMMSSCESTIIDGYNVVVNPKLLVNTSKTDIDNNEIEEVVSKDVVTPLPTITPTATSTPTVAPTPTLTPEEKKLKEYESYFKIYDYCYIESNRDRYLAYLEKFPGTPVIDAMTSVNIGLDNDCYTNVTDIVNPSSPLVICNKYNKLPSDYIPEGYPKLNDEGTPEVNYKALKGESGAAFNEMKKAAAEKGLNIFPASAYRSYDYQNTVYWKKSPGGYKGNGKLTKEQREAYQNKRDEVSARAGFSEHQTGLAIDINSDSTSFENTKEGQWLFKNSYKYGFILRYPKGKDKITGYNYEPWHYRYVGVNVATAVYNSGLTYDEFYARYILPVFIKYPEASKLSGDEFYDKYLKSFFESYVYNGLADDVNDALIEKGYSPIMITPYPMPVSDEVVESNDEVLVKVA